jgi:tRNA-2-methylthio-N6-dimethylallyladenosine synthase
MLERMRRRHTGDDYRRLVERLRDSRPDLAITTDLIVGFPGESDEDFSDTLRLVRDLRFTDSFSFKYSPRPGTTAASFSDAVPERVSQRRLEELQDLQRSLTLDAHRSRVGETTEVLVEGPSRRGGVQLVGRDPFHRIVNFSSEPERSPVPGSLVRMEIVEATPHSLIGALAEERGVAPGPLKETTANADEHRRGAAIGA